ncbi:sigma-70 family RNA polymerase sigma factor [Ferruginibacter yonginensis]|uniref:Sigma-70 family RNA polymerase sigma factor n=1 Tax=Ferruginibacter yonginensis TaxID=1310416 RepID=A0ABV8QUW7_9BACT
MQQNRVFIPENWVDNYADELFRYTIVRVKDVGFAEDIVQETFLSAWRAKESYNGLASEKNWLYAICKNKIIDHFRKQTHNAAIASSAEEDYYFEGTHWNQQAGAPKEWNINYDKRIEAKEFYTVLEKCKNKLKSIQQHVFVMKFMDDMDADKICEILNITASNYWVLVHRCKLHLRSCLEKNWINIQ